MATQTLMPGAGIFRNGLLSFTVDTNRPEIIPSLRASASRTIYFRNLSLTSLQNSTQRLILTDSSSGTDTSGDGEDLSNKWEAFRGAVLIEAASISYELPGPRTTFIAFPTDFTEPYNWGITRAYRQRLGTFITAYNNLTDDEKAATKITLRDEYPPPILEATGPLAGRPSGALTAQATLITPCLLYTSPSPRDS